MFSIDCDCLNSNNGTTTSDSTKNECLNDQLIVLKYDNPFMMKFQLTLEQHLLKQRNNIKQELLTLVSKFAT